MVASHWDCCCHSNRMRMCLPLHFCSTLNFFLLQFFQWLVLLQCPSRNYTSSAIVSCPDPAFSQARLNAWTCRSARLSHFVGSQLVGAFVGKQVVGQLLIVGLWYDSYEVSKVKVNSHTVWCQYCCVYHKPFCRMYMIRVSLSEPHTSGASFRTHACLLGPTTYGIFQMSIFEYGFHDHMHFAQRWARAKVRRYCQTATLLWKKPGVKTTQSKEYRQRAR